MTWGYGGEKQGNLRMHHVGTTNNYWAPVKLPQGNMIAASSEMADSRCSRFSPAWHSVYPSYGNFDAKSYAAQTRLVLHCGDNVWMKAWFILDQRETVKTFGFRIVLSEFQFSDSWFGLCDVFCCVCVILEKKPGKLSWSFGVTTLIMHRNFLVPRWSWRGTSLSCAPLSLESMCWVRRFWKAGTIAQRICQSELHLESPINHRVFHQPTERFRGEFQCWSLEIFRTKRPGHDWFLILKDHFLMAGPKLPEFLREWYVMQWEWHLFAILLGRNFARALTWTWSFWTTRYCFTMQVLRGACFDSFAASNIVLFLWWGYVVLQSLCPSFSLTADSHLWVSKLHLSPLLLTRMLWKQWIKAHLVCFLFYICCFALFIRQVPLTMDSHFWRGKEGETIFLTTQRHKQLQKRTFLSFSSEYFRKEEGWWGAMFIDQNLWWGGGHVMKSPGLFSSKS